jgi:ATP-binding cassette subfamily F protein 3
MTLIALRDIHKSYGSEVIFHNLNVQFHPGQRVGLIGPNGSGKTTLFRLITGQTHPDMGEVTAARNMKIGYLAQEPELDLNRTVLEEMHEGFVELLAVHHRIEQLSHDMATLSGDKLQSTMKEYDRLRHQFETDGGYSYEARVKSTLLGLGIEQELFEQKISVLSGGQRSRLSLAKILITDADLLLLDEPTNHLDLQAIQWLEKFLVNSNKAVIIVSHDRYLLDAVAERIVELDSRRARSWRGNYSQYIETKEVLTLQLERQHRKRLDFVTHELDFIARNKDQEGMRGTAKGRKTRLMRMLKENPDYLDKPTEQKTIRFSFAEAKIRSDIICRAEGLSKAFGPIVLFEDLTFDLYRGTILGITGPNGTGKSTLLKMAMGTLPPDKGIIRMGKTLRLGYLDQHASVLDPEATVLQEMAKVRPDLLPEQLRGKLGMFLFSGDDVFKKTGNLSGGQQNRLILARLVLAEPDVLILDEPTNHLDIASREMLEAALDEFNGAVIAVSHDRYFLDRLADQLLIVGCDELGEKQLGRSEFIIPIEKDKGVWTTYTELLQQRRAADAQQKQKKSASQKSAAQTNKPRTAAPPELKQFNRYSTEQIETMIAETEDKIAVMQDQFGSEEVYRYADKVARLQKDFDDAKAHRDLLYRAWEYKSQ